MTEPSADQGLPSDDAVRAWVRLMRAQDIVLGAIEGELKAAGFPPLAWYDVLLELRRAEQWCLRPLEIEERLLLAQHNVSRMIDRLEKAGLVERRPCSTDGRGQEVAITPAGLDLQQRMWPVYRRAIARHVGDRIGPEAGRLADLLERLLAKPA